MVGPFGEGMDREGTWGLPEAGVVLQLDLVMVVVVGGESASLAVGPWASYSTC